VVCGGSPRARQTRYQTSNLPFDELNSVLGSERLTGALLVRLTHHVHIQEMNGDEVSGETHIRGNALELKK